MRKDIHRKGFVCGIILVFVGLSLVPSITGNRNENTNFVFPWNKPSLADDTITDWAEDVCAIDQYTGNISIVTDNPYITVDNIDVVHASYTQQGLQVTLTLQVAGKIEDRGTDPHNPNELLELVEYDFQVTTSEQEYWISYINKTGFLEYGNETINLTSSDFSVDDDTLSITFSLIDAEEIYESISVSTAYIRADLSDPYSYDITFLYDMAPNPPLMKAMFIGVIRNVTTRQDYITFNPVRMTTVRFMPFSVNKSSSELIVISKKHIGYVGHRIIIGLFNVADIFLQNILSYSLYHRIINAYYHHR